MAGNFGSSESLTVVLIFSPKPAAFEVGPRGLLHFVSVLLMCLTSNVSLICGDGREYMFSSFSLSFNTPISIFLSLLLSALLSTDD